jgi:superfamily II DNA/RNA helicase
MGASSPFPIQTATIPEALTGRDILARGHTGSGKTIAFGAALVERLAPGGKTVKRRGSGRAPSALILAPTRELALQIDRTVQPLARAAGLFTTQIVGGVPQGRQVQALQRGVDIVIGTPGRLEDLITQGHLTLDEVWVTVIDEADHMSELGFAEPVDRLLTQTQGGGQKLFFSATLDRAVAQLVEKFLVAPAIFELQTSDEASASIDHHVFVIDQRDKREIVQRLSAGDKKTLVFTRTRADAKNLAEHLDGLGIPAVALHGDLSQGQRQRNLGKLGSGRAQVLVATDVAARGIHVDDIALVIHADPAEEHKTYVHRSGRTGRAGGTGRVVTLATKSRQREVDSLLHRAGIEWTTTTMGLGDRALADFTAE